MLYLRDISVWHSGLKYGEKNFFKLNMNLKCAAPKTQKLQDCIHIIEDGFILT